MEENDTKEAPATLASAAASPVVRRAPAAIAPQSGSAPCPTCGTGAAAPGGHPSFVYAIGRIEQRFPSPAVEKEFAQAAGRAQTSGKTDREVFHAILSQRENRYLARQLCWVLIIQGLDTYLLQPRDPADFDLLVEAIRPVPSPSDVDVVVGVRGPIAPAEMCNGLMVPIVTFDQIYSFDRKTLIAAIPRPDKAASDEAFNNAAEELFDRVMQLTDNAGATDEHRALNYLALRYPRVYSAVVDAFARNESLSGVDVRPSALSGVRSIVDVVFTFTHRATDVDEKSFVRVDVTEQFPFLVTKLAPYYDR